MKKKLLIFAGITAVLILVGFAVNRVWVENTKPIETKTDSEAQSDFLPAPDSVKVSVSWSKSVANTVVLSVTGMEGKMASLRYSLSYESLGQIKGVDSGKQLDVSGKDTFERNDIYLGTCSRNVCKPDTGVTQANVVLEFVDAKGLKYQFDRDFTLEK